MKRKIFLLVSALIVFSQTSQAAVGDKFTAGGIEYEITSESPAEAAVGKNDEFVGSSAEIPASVIKDGTVYAVTSIGRFAFFNNIGVKSIKLPESIKIIDYNAFSRSGITSVVVPGSVTTIDNNVFYNCDYLTSVEIGRGVTVIGTYSFSSCPKLERVKLGSGITRLQTYVFYDCPSLISVECAAATPPETWFLAIGGTTPIESASLYVPIGSKEKYAAADTWKDFGTITEKDFGTGLSILASQGIQVWGGRGEIRITTPAEFITSAELVEANTVNVYNLSGALVRTAAIGGGDILIANISAGIYIVRIGDGAEKVIVR